MEERVINMSEEILKLEKELENTKAILNGSDWKNKDWERKYNELYEMDKILKKNNGVFMKENLRLNDLISKKNTEIFEKINKIIELGGEIPIECLKTYKNEAHNAETLTIKEADKYQKIEELMREIKLCNIRNSELEKSLKSAEERLIIEKKSSDLVKQSYSELREKYLEAKEILKKYENKEKEWENKLKKFAKRKEDWLKEKIDLEGKIEKLRHSNETVIKQHKINLEIIKALELENAQQKEKCEEYFSTFANESNNIYGFLHYDKSILQEDNKQLLINFKENEQRETIEKLENENLGREEKLQKLFKIIEKLEEEKLCFCEKIQTSEETLQNKDEEINNLIEEISSLTSQNNTSREEMRIKLSEMEAENELNRQEKERLLNENKEKTLFLENEINEMSELIKNIKNFEDSESKNIAKIQELQWKIDELHQEINRLNIENYQYQLNLNMMQEQLLKSNNDAPDQSLHLSSQTENIKKLEQELNEVNEKYESLRRKAAENCSIIEDMKKQIYSFDNKTKFYYENKIDFLEENINELTEQCASLEKQLDESKFYIKENL